MGVGRLYLQPIGRRRVACLAWRSDWKSIWTSYPPRHHDRLLRPLEKGDDLMKLFILGATGGTGLHLVGQTLARGPDVTALVRSPQKITRRDPKLSVRSGDPLSVSQLR